jgi:hypothetical protein
MDITSIKVPNGNSVYLFDKFYPDDILVKLTNICSSFSSDSTDWLNAEWTTLRYNYKNCEYLDSILKSFCEDIFFNLITPIVHYKMNYISSSLFVDLPGLGPLQPHVEGPEGGTYLMQIYLTDQPEPFNGTTIYNDDKQILFQLPYRNNFGWLFDQATGVMHGRHSDVAPNLKRFSIMTRFI